ARAATPSSCPRGAPASRNVTNDTRSPPTTGRGCGGARNRRVISSHSGDSSSRAATAVPPTSVSTTATWAAALNAVAVTGRGGRMRPDSRSISNMASAAGTGRPIRLLYRLTTTPFQAFTPPAWGGPSQTLTGRAANLHLTYRPATLLYDIS